MTKIQVISFGRICAEINETLTWMLCPSQLIANLIFCSSESLNIQCFNGFSSL
ncbi:hypothetical protein RchiOBHm_Chr7g0237001 [Rosa chinensis]|uniref:Uncharacterized protein n=1 Tax=Rosa chinensis TaxID=74649 RepID=A0A2P6PH39_ROSCH|nr:hypothetical protein RchiOBHm_Chr7g0237001 [Rosa chinensis]